MSTIGFSGIGSGLPIDDIIKATVQAEAAPLRRLQAEKEATQAQISAYGQLSNRLAGLRTAMGDLKGIDKFEQLKATSTNTELFTATANHRTGATAGNYSVEVLKGADNARWVSAATGREATLSGTFNLQIGDVDDNDPINFDIVEKLGSEATMDDLRSYLNREFGEQLSVNLVNIDDDNARLVINSQVSGEVGRITGISIGTEGEPGHLAENTQDLSTPALDAGNLATSLDAHIKIDGIAVSSSTNRFENVISGVTINLAEGVNSLVDPGEGETRAASLSVAQDKDAIKGRVDNFILAYNDLIIHLNEQKKGDLAGESVLRSIENTLRDTLTTPTGDGSDLSNTLSALGIGTFVERGWNPGEAGSSRNGTLEIMDTERFNDVLENDMERLAKIFGDPDTGYAKRFEQLATRLERDSVVDGRNQQGLVSSRVQGLNREIGRIDDRISATDRRLDLLEQRLYSQFGTVDAMIANINASGDYLMAQFDSLPGYTRNKK